MLQKIQDQLSKEENQRLILHAVGLVATFVATQAFAGLMNRGIDLGIDSLMAKIHNTVEQAAG